MDPFNAASHQSLAVRNWCAVGKALFVEAAQTGDLQTLQFLHSILIGVVNCSHDGMTALNTACREGQNAAAVWLLDVAKADVQRPDEGVAGYRAIHYAAKQNNCNLLQMLIERGAQLDDLCKDQEKTALHIAIEEEATECVRLLIEEGCDVNLQDSDWCTPLHAAISLDSTVNSLRIIELLVSSGRINWRLPDLYGRTVLHVAVKNRNLRVTQLILNKGGNELVTCMLEDGWMDGCMAVYSEEEEEIERKVGQLLLDHLASSGTDRFKALVEAKNPSGMTPLLIACKTMDYCLIELLVEAGADVKAVSNDGDTACLLVALSSCVNGKKPSIQSSPEIFKKLETYPAHPLLGYLIGKGCCWESKNISGQTAAALLIRKGYKTDVIEALNQLSSSILCSSNGSSCMGRNGCIQPPTYQLFCLHKKSVYRVCAYCSVSIPDEKKCKCADERIIPIEIEIIDLDDSFISM